MKTKRCNANKLLVYQWQQESARPDPGINADKLDLQAARPVGNREGATDGAYCS